MQQDNQKQIQGGMELKITDLDSEGRGIARLSDGCVVFVPHAITGERITATITAQKKSFATARLDEIIEASPHRTVPVCKVFYKCGGCSLQHIDYERQLKFKKDMVSAQLKRLGGIMDAEVFQAEPSPQKLGYRNKAVFRLISSNNVPRMGFFEEQSHRLVDTDYCHICSLSINKAAKIVREYVSKNPALALARAVQRGELSTLTIREIDGEILLDFAFEGKPPEDLGRLFEELEKQFARVGIFATKNGKTRHVFGSKHISGNALGIDFDVSMQAFLQVNSEVSTRLYSEAIRQAGITNSDIVVDAYCGIGILTALMAKKAAHVYGIEIIAEAIMDAKKLAEKNSVSNTTFLTGDCARILPQLLGELRASHGSKTLSVVLDPPRKGCAKEVITALNTSLPDKIIYISCNSATLCRDLKELSQFYKIKSITPFDMFPQTADVETLVCLEKR